MGIVFNKNTYLGGASCKVQLDGACSEEKAKGAYPDILLVLLDRVLIVEVDENRHRFYEQSCELARYDTLQFGSTTLLPSRIVRFNPHDTPNVQLDLTAKLRILIQRIRDYLNEELDIDAAPVESVQFLFYGQVGEFNFPVLLNIKLQQGSEHRTFADQAASTLSVFPDINDLTMSLDADVMAFVLSDLMSADTSTAGSVVSKIRELGGRENRCDAFSSRTGRRCSAVALKNSNVCSRHSRMKQRGKIVMFNLCGG
ncbi:hypothetical protein BDR26DRAFT_615693 [Obelidium mucronatum]|nr:hypothetical protein BDR26DRAFT_615693 [Obelidium mucronatum]